MMSKCGWCACDLDEVAGYYNKKPLCEPCLEHWIDYEQEQQRGKSEAEQQAMAEAEAAYNADANKDAQG